MRSQKTKGKIKYFLLNINFEIISINLLLIK